MAFHSIGPSTEPRGFPAVTEYDFLPCVYVYMYLKKKTRYEAFGYKFRNLTPQIVFFCTVLLFILLFFLLLNSIFLSLEKKKSKVRVVCGVLLWLQDKL